MSAFTLKAGNAERQHRRPCQKQPLLPAFELTQLEPKNSIRLGGARSPQIRSQIASYDPMMEVHVTSIPIIRAARPSTF